VAGGAAAHGRARQPARVLRTRERYPILERQPHHGGPLLLSREPDLCGRALAGAAVERSDFRALPGPSVFRTDLASGTVDPATVPFTDKIIRAGFVLD